MHIVDFVEEFSISITLLSKISLDFFLWEASPIKAHFQLPFLATTFSGDKAPSLSFESYNKHTWLKVYLFFQCNIVKHLFIPTLQGVNPKFLTFDAFSYRILFVQQHKI